VQTETETVAERILREGEGSLIDSCRAAGLRTVPSLRYLMRAAITGKLDAIKIAGRWRTSPDAIKRLIARSQASSRTPPPPPRRADSNAVLARYGLGREGA